MVFKSRKELNGETDSNINTLGRIKPQKELTKRAIKERELMSLARKIKPLMAEAIGTASKIMKNNEATHASQLKAAVILLDAYRSLVNDLYESEDENEQGTEVQDTRPVFSLTMIDPDKK